MIISRTPFRVSLFGGGTDFPQWYLKHGGAVLGFALNRYCYVSVRKLPPFFEYTHRIVYSKMETVKSAQDIDHPCVRHALEFTGLTCGMEIHHDGDLPARSGLGSSSAFAVGLLHALHAMRGQMRSKDRLAAEAIYLEQSIIKENVGSQDQVWAAHGGFNWIDFASDTGEINVTSIALENGLANELVSRLVLVFTGFSRKASEIEGRKMAALHTHEEQMWDMRTLTERAMRALVDGDLDTFGCLLSQAWLLKRQLADGVTAGAIDEIYEMGISCGALGGKLLGAGGGGFMLFYVPPERQIALREECRKRGLVTLPAGIDYGGSRIVVYEPES